MFGSTSLKLTLVGIALGAGMAATASAAQLPLSYTTTAPVTPYVGVTTGSGTITDASTLDTYFYGNSYNAPLANTLYTSASNVNYNFYDDFVFTVSGSTLNSVSSTISLGNIFTIDNLQARLYTYTASGNWQPYLAGPPGGCPSANCVEGWGTSYSAGGNNVTVSILNNVTVSAGTYVLELRGNVTGVAGGSYSGALNVAPVPVPGALWLMTSAIVGLGTVGRKRVYK